MITLYELRKLCIDRFSGEHVILAGILIAWAETDPQKELSNLLVKTKISIDDFLRAIQPFLNTTSNDDDEFSLFIKCYLVIILVYIDDLIITGNNNSLIDHVIGLICREFECRDLSSMGFFLGMEISTDSGTLLLTQTRYATDLLKKFGMENCSPCSTLLQPGIHLQHDDGELLPMPPSTRA